MTFQAPDPVLVLASQSATRRTLLERAGLRFEALPAAVDEAALKESAQAEGIPADDAAIMLAEAKAERIARRIPDALVIGCDQLLTCRMEDGKERWFDKPADLGAARAQLLALRGRTHRLVTATVAWRGGARIWQDVSVPRLTMRSFSEAFLDAYLAAEGEVLCASVGGYRLEALGVHLFSRVEGEHSAILGLPMLPLLGFLRGHGVLTG
ncbi:septum formation protein Maf [Falsiroseomonas bella]|uniref:Nucleoside triphosphate pyrophosphatase n=1 Tax=Falsiroseomonas bella TaxID=2184016 RepID=A0A317FHZ0_9PROT|nr:Maf family protein [Falsiroseomonas bella]PWS38630.1 septum formation protein Maf [Falsiroseomonas bella]